MSDAQQETKKPETDQERNIRLANMIDELLSKEGFELMPQIQKVQVKMSDNMPPTYVDCAVVAFIPKRSSIIVPSASQQAIDNAIKATALGTANGQRQTFPNGMKAV